jgi:hypothetical protein
MTVTEAAAVVVASSVKVTGMTATAAAPEADASVDRRIAGIVVVRVSGIVRIGVSVAGISVTWRDRASRKRCRNPEHSNDPEHDRLLKGGQK